MYIKFYFLAIIIICIFFFSQLLLLSFPFIVVPVIIIIYSMTISFILFISSIHFTCVDNIFLEVFSYYVFNVLHIVILHDYDLNLSTQLMDIRNS